MSRYRPRRLRLRTCEFFVRSTTRTAIRTRQREGVKTSQGAEKAFSATNSSSLLPMRPRILAHLQSRAQVERRSSMRICSNARCTSGSATSRRRRCGSGFVTSPLGSWPSVRKRWRSPSNHTRQTTSRAVLNVRSRTRRPVLEMRWTSRQRLQKAVAARWLPQWSTPSASRRGVKVRKLMQSPTQLYSRCRSASRRFCSSCLRKCSRRSFSKNRIFTRKRSSRTKAPVPFRVRNSSSSTQVVWLWLGLWPKSK
mmetsp:Transcript_6948/g.16900  ORF Transcript_6948/g.16900 Transcript_6948/m.16900 type:complete len:253 (-) Transcript_6948:2476-3234(-)